MQHLKELGVDTSKATMCWIIDEENKNNPFVVLRVDASDHVDITTYSLPTFTLQDILDLLPAIIKVNSYTISDIFWLELGMCRTNKSLWYVQYRSIKDYIYKTIHNENNLIDAAYEMLCWCVENGYVETKNNNK